MLAKPHTLLTIPRVRIGAWTVTILLFMASTIALPAFAKEGKRVAFVVGINTYENLGKDKYLERAVSDARTISRSLKSLGYEVIEGIDVTLSDFDKKWQAALEKTTSEDTLLFFFSGHGVEIDGENFLLPRNVPYFAFGRDKQFKRRAVSVTELMADLKTGDRKPPKVTVMILDACRDNPTIPPQYKTKGMMPQGGLAKVPKTRGTFILYAAEPGKLSLDRLGPDDTDPNSVFTRSLLPLLGQANLSIQNLAIQVKEQVHALTGNYEQLPEYTDGLIGQFCLAGCAVNADKNLVPDQIDGKEMLKVAGSKQPQKPLKTKKPTAQTSDKLPSIINGKDRAPMVLVPDGEFMMGSREEDDGSARNDEQPAHRVFLDAFYIDQYEVTIAQYAKFIEEENQSEPANWSADVVKRHKSKPVVGMSWRDANAYCAWTGKRLPTEAEWEKAARGTDHRLYPWGNVAPGSRANFGHCCEFDNYDALTTVGYFKDGKSPYGVYDMAGNAWEWTADWYDANYYSNSPNRNPRGPSSGEDRVLRGGAWTLTQAFVRSASRHKATPMSRNFNDVGFRCAQDAIQ